MSRKRYSLAIDVSQGNQTFVLNTTAFKEAKEVSVFLTFLGLNGATSTFSLKSADDPNIVGQTLVDIDSEVVTAIPAGGITIAGGQIIQDHAVLDFIAGDRTAGTVFVVVIAK